MENKETIDYILDVVKNDEHDEIYKTAVSAKCLLPYIIDGSLCSNLQKILELFMQSEVFVKAMNCVIYLTQFEDYDGNELEIYNLTELYDNIGRISQFWKPSTFDVCDAIRTEEIQEMIKDHNLPELQVGDICNLFYDLWDGNGEFPLESGNYSYRVGEQAWINYTFVAVDASLSSEEIEEVNVKITGIELI